MSVPESPYTRKEMYLDAIARGDSSGIPERPYTREEMYLDAIAKNGGGGGGGGSSSLSGLTDVDISNPTDGQTLVYNATSGKWENGAGGGGSSALIAQVTVDPQVHDGKPSLNKTWQEISDAISNGVPSFIAWDFVSEAQETGTQFMPVLSVSSVVYNNNTIYVVYTGPCYSMHGDYPAFTTTSAEDYPFFD